MNLAKRVKNAEKLSQIAWERVKQKESERRMESAKAKAAALWIPVLSAKIGEEFTITKQEFDQEPIYVFEPQENGDVKFKRIK